jgi:hypothetical protein
MDTGVTALSEPPIHLSIHIPKSACCDPVSLPEPPNQSSMRLVQKASSRHPNFIGFFASNPAGRRWSNAYRLLTMRFRNNAIIRISVTRNRSSPRKS